MSGRKLNVVAFAAHPADAIERAGGTLANYSRAGHEVEIITLSYGEQGEAPASWKDGKSIEDIKKTKAKELREAARILGVRHRVLDFGDDPIVMNKERNHLLADIIRELKADIILTHWLSDPFQPDHETTTQSVISAVRHALVRGVQKDPESAPHFLELQRNFYMYTPTRGVSDVSGFSPDTFIDIGETIKVKEEATKCFASQTLKLLAKEKPEGMHDYFTNLCAPWRGWQSGVKFAEAFVHYGRGKAFKFFPI